MACRSALATADQRARALGMEVQRLRATLPTSGPAVDAVAVAVVAEVPEVPEPAAALESWTAATCDGSVRADDHVLLVGVAGAPSVCAGSEGVKTARAGCEAVCAVTAPLAHVYAACDRGDIAYALVCLGRRRACADSEGEGGGDATVTG